MGTHDPEPVEPALAQLDPHGLFHLATRDEWVAYQAAGSITPPSLESEGFVHCSWGRQVAGTVAKHFDGVTDLLALSLDADALGGPTLVEEDSYGSGQAFPHVYGPIPVASVSGTHAITARS